VKSDEVILVGVKSSVLAVSRLNGQIIWAAALAGGIGDGFVTVVSDGVHVIAHTHGIVHCLDFATGQILWTNELAGYGYGIASLCLPGSATAPDAGAVKRILAAREEGTNASATSSVH
jgi:outer membrane protein assembly factor BamB